MNLEQVKQAIASRGLSWQAGETSRSGLTASQMKSGQMGTRTSNKLNVSAAKFSQAAEEFQALLDEISGASPPPDSFNWLESADNESLEIVGAPRDQSPGMVGCNSCVAFAVVGAVEARMNLAAGQPNGDVNLSEGYLFFRGCGEPKGCKNCREAGWTIPEGLRFATDFGIPSEEAFPYDPATSSPPPILTPIVKLTRWRPLPPQDIKKALIVRGPLVVEMTLFDDFAYYIDGVYEPVSTKTLGTHAVTIVGYSNGAAGVPGHWICKNSWGSDWGATASGTVGRGFFSIKYGDCGIASTFAAYEPSVHVQLTLSEATAAIQRVLEVASTNEALRKCLKGRFRQGRGTSLCGSQSTKEIATACEEILAAYPKLREPFKAQLV